MGRTDEALFEKLVEVALKDELDVSLYALIDLDFSCVAVSPYCLLADVKPGYDVVEKDYRLSVEGQSRSVVSVVGNRIARPGTLSIPSEYTPCCDRCDCR